MVRKFDKEQFTKRFLDLLKERYSHQRGTTQIIGMSTVALQACRDLKFAMWKNRDGMLDAINEWWEKLPKAKGERAYGGRRLFGRDCRVACSSGPTFIYIKNIPSRLHGILCEDIICWW